MDNAWEAHDRSAVLADPFGHGFCLVELLHGGYDELTGPAPTEAGREAAPERWDTPWR